MTEKTVRRTPKLYGLAGKILQKVKEEGESVKTLVYEAHHPNLKALYALVLETLKHGQQLDYLIRKTQILIDNPRLNPWLSRVLMTELLWQKKALNAVSIPQEIVLSYHEKFLSELGGAPMNKAVQDSPGSSNTAQPVRYVRVNTLKDTTENVVKWFTDYGWEEVSIQGNITKDFIKKAQRLSSYQFMQDCNVPDLLVFPHSFKFYENNLFLRGIILLQDKASCISPILLNPPTNSVVLDMCAAPGMKTTQIAALIGNTGSVYAVEVNKRRYDTLCETIEKSGATCVETINDDVLRQSNLQDVEYILLDPPCSGSGMLTRQRIFQEEGSKDPQRLVKLANFQCSLLRHAMTSFTKVKRIVYSTCSVHPEENEAVVDSVLRAVPPNFVPIENPPHAAWMIRGSSDYEHGSCGFYARPETHLTNGFFVAVFERSDHKYESFSRSFNGVQDASNSHCNETNYKKKKKRQKREQEELHESDNAESRIKEATQPDDAAQKMLRAMQRMSTPTESAENPEVNGDAITKRNKETKSKANERKIDPMKRKKRSEFDNDLDKDVERECDESTRCKMKKRIRRQEKVKGRCGLGAADKSHTC